MQMNDVQSQITELKKKGWTLAAIADELDITVNAVQKWQAGDHSPNRATLVLLDQLLARKRIPPQRRSATGKYRQRNISCKLPPEAKT